MKDKIEIHINLDANKAYVWIIRPEPEDIDRHEVRYYTYNYSVGACGS